MIYFSLAAQSKRNAQCSKNLENLQRWNQRQANKSQRSGTGELSMQSCSPQKEDTNYRKDLPAAGTILILTKHSVLWGHCCEYGEGGISGVSIILL